jgi:MarR family transcriptional regulator, lower aerobic nicotinate degradation pathway regulator
MMSTKSDIPSQTHIPPQTLCLPQELVASTAFLLARVGISMKVRVMDEMESAGFAGYQYGVLALLGEGATETQARIADVLGLDRSQLVGELDDLEERGLIERRRDPNDRRRHMVTLTTDGKRQLVKLRAIVKRIEDSFLEPLGEDERKQLHDVLLRVACSHDGRYKRAV